jgi:hypothetical protein
MIIKLTKIADDADNMEAGDIMLVNIEHISVIFSDKIVRKVPIVGMDNVIFGSVVTLDNGRAFAVKEKAEDIYNALTDKVDASQ